MNRLGTHFNVSVVIYNPLYVLFIFIKIHLSFKYTYFLNALSFSIYNDVLDYKYSI